ncbi:hypothetical protein QYE76_004941 [Lolium multiflorum]|uniref:Ribonuclease H1 N-terminal domain-containing protein n=1 Tax=Lolium multiflorum TaxID=4521 RepID=A0AAD8RVI3_LOLMU|nr:hypothetical protein QYE76_004941 [Lolium multiflorum]
MENYSLLMGAAAVMKMAVEMAGVDGEAFRGHFPVRRRAGTETPVPRSWPRWRRLWKGAKRCGLRHADIFFIAHEDVFKLFHSRRLDYNLVRLFALNLAMKIKRESTPDVAIADPYYMHESQLVLSAPENSTLEAFYVMHHLKGFVRDSQNLLLPSALRGWAEKLARINDDDLREDFHDTQVKLSHISFKTSSQGEGSYTRVERYARGTSNNASKRRVTGGQMPTYVVYKGQVPSVYEEWQDCLEQVHKFSGNSYKGYVTREEAVAQWRAHVGKKKKNRLKFPSYSPPLWLYSTLL